MAPNEKDNKGKKYAQLMVCQWKQLCHSKVTVPYRLSRIEISAFALDSIFANVCETVCGMDEKIICTQKCDGKHNSWTKRSYLYMYITLQPYIDICFIGKATSI